MRYFKFLEGCDVEITPSPAPPREIISRELIEQRIRDTFGEQTFVTDLSVEYNHGVCVITTTIMTRNFYEFIDMEINPTESQDLL